MSVDDFLTCHPDRESQLDLPPGMAIYIVGHGASTYVAIHGITCFPVVVWTALGVGTDLRGEAEQVKVHMTCNNHISDLLSLRLFTLKNCLHTNPWPHRMPPSWLQNMKEYIHALQGKDILST